MTRHWASMGEAGAVKGMRFMVWVHAVLGRPVFSLILVPVMVYYFLRRGEARRASGDFLRRVKAHCPGALGDRPFVWLSFRHFLAFGHSLLDKVLAWIRTPDTIAMEPEQERQLFELVDSGVGCLVIGSHFGNLEYSRGIAHRHPNLVINVLTHDRHAVKFAEIMQQSEPQSRLNLLQVTDLDIQLALTLKEKLQDGEWLVIAGDRVPLGESERVCQANFVGHPARFPIGPYVLANLMGCPVYLFHCFLVGGEYRLVLEHFSDGVKLSRKNRQDDLEQLTQRYACALEKQVARSPLQWFNFYDFWADSTTGDPAL